MTGLEAREDVRAARRALYRDRVLDAAEALFAEQGFAATRMQEVAARSGVSLRSVYAAFSGKAALFDAIGRERREALLARLRAEQPGPGALAALLAGVRVAVHFLLAHPDFLRIHLRDGNAWATSRARDDRWQRVVAQQTQVFRRGIAEGVFVDEDPELLARTMIATYQVHLAHSLEQPGGVDPEAVVAGIEAHVRRAYVRR